MNQSCYFFFFKQKTAYEMRISDWSSDVCSSVLAPRRRHVGDAAGNAERDVDLPRHALDPGRVDAAPVRAGADVVEHQLVGAGIAIARRQRDDVAHVDVVAEAHALDHAAGTHVEAGDDEAAQHASGPARLIWASRSARPSTMPAQPAVSAARMSAMSRAPPERSKSTRLNSS